jgi:hypothetical protein
LITLRIAVDRFRAYRGPEALKLAFTLAVLAYLAHALGRIGWEALIEEAPAAPAFYALFLVRFMVLPVTEVLLYGRLWQRDLWPALPVFLKKRVFNLGLLDYSGEAFFYAWARRLPGVSAFQTIKDVNLLSVIAANLFTMLCLGLFLGAGSARQLAALPGGDGPAVLAGVAMLILTVAVALAFRRRLFSLSPPQLLEVFGWHSLRLLLVLGLTTAQWWAAVPEVPVTVWLTFLAAYMLLGRLPLPNRELLFLGLSLPLAGLLDTPGAMTESMFLMNAALTQIAMLVSWVIAARFPGNHDRLFTPRS